MPRSSSPSLVMGTLFGMGWAGWMTGLGAACDWVTRAAIRIRNPHDALGDVMLDKTSLMLLIHWAKVPYISLMLGRGVTRVEAEVS